MSANLFVSLLVVLFAKLALSALVPRIQTSNVQLEPINDNKYTLRINQLGAVREENVEEIAPGEFLVKGQLNQQFEPQSGTLIVTYEAGRNGYIAKYTYVTKEGLQIPLGLSPDALKSITG
ncbi:uncharacterized protein [Drosophila virilis]|uniref:Uncharacterized protein n=1 Tax=Drosophila virilis TaxID=7244 RepID=B4LEF8_DROVI|nr:uncharacterized protein LOC6623570 [Drosophila virilis]EDW70134.2 uncharacterized protein Dvir_GJ13632 [Drosophila virilis]